MASKKELEVENRELREKMFDMEQKHYTDKLYFEHLIIKYQAILDEHDIGDEICKKRGLNIFGLSDPRFREL